MRINFKKMLLIISLLVFPIVGLAQPKIAILMLYTPNLENFARYSEAINKKYANKHQYDFIVKKTRYQSATSNFAPQWDKLLMVREYLPQYDYVVWIDADAVVMQMDKTIESFIATKPQADFWIARDMIERHADDMNSGVFIAKNSAWNLKMLDQAMVMPSCQAYANKDYYEQSCLEIIYGKNLWDAKKHFYILSADEFNTKLNRNAFVYHLMQEEYGLREKEFKEIFAAINTENKS